MIFYRKSWHSALKIKKPSFRSEKKDAGTKSLDRGTRINKEAKVGVKVSYKYRVKNHSFP